ncbi:MAG: hypothetical protein ABMB14_23485 [Myxococcota bacterium]
MIEAAANWFRIVDALAAAGFGPADLVQVCVRATVRAYEPHGPDEPVLAAVFDRADPATLTAVCDAVLPRRRDPYRDGMLGCVALAALAAREPPPPRFDPLVSFYCSSRRVRALLLALPAARREAALEYVLDQPHNPINGAWRLEQALPVRDLFGESQVARLAARVDAVRTVDDPRAIAVVAAYDAGGVGALPVRGADGLTDGTRSGVEYLLQKAEEAARAARLGPVAEARVDRGLEVDAPELDTLEAWVSATDARREAIGRAVEAAGAAIGLRFDGIARPVDLPVARFQCGAHAMVLIPGGSFRRGFSDAEEEALRAAGEAAGEDGNTYEEFGALLERVGEMRPVIEVTIRPLLLGVVPTQPVDPAIAADQFEASPFRLPSEAELERALRGGRDGQLTYAGDEAVDEAWMFDQPPHPFGLERVGHYPEACSDVFAPGYTGAPTDGGPRLGRGSRVARGGAAMVSPWQDCGEWQLLTNAVRGPLAAWEYFASWRPALGLTPPRPSTG